MLKKRVTSIFLSIFIVTGVVASDYSTVMAVDIPTAFWGTLEYSRAFFTAMQTGGALDRGINFEDFTKSTQRQWQELAPKVMEAYQLFCFYKEKVVVSTEHPDWTMEQINSEAVTRSFKLKDDFENNAIKVSTTTGNISLKDWGYWQEFCKEFSGIAQNGISQGGEVTSSTPVNVTIRNYGSGFTTPLVDISNIYGNTISFQQNNYIYKGNYDYVYLSNNEIVERIQEIDCTSSDSSRVIIPYIIMQNDIPYERLLYKLCKKHYRLLTGEFITSDDESWNTINYNSKVQQDVVDKIVNGSSLPIVICTNSNYNQIVYTLNNNISDIKVNISASSALDWQYKSQEALDDSEAGSSIKKGNTAQKTKTVVREGSVPIKRSSLKEEEQDGTKVVSGVIGWDIPQSRVIEGTIANPAEEDEEIRQIGVIDVPAEDIIDRPEEEDIVIPADTPIVVPEDEVIDGPVIPVPIQKILEIQYGPFYPTSMDITQFFPFCIPFDIAYCINKFRVGEGEAPIITIPIVYPRVLQHTLGESYTVTIDFNDYIALRNIIRYFILLLFIVGLMTITRNLIRG